MRVLRELVKLAPLLGVRTSKSNAWPLASRPAPSDGQRWAGPCSPQTPVVVSRTALTGHLATHVPLSSSWVMLVQTAASW